MRKKIFKKTIALFLIVSLLFVNAPINKVQAYKKSEEVDRMELFASNGCYYPDCLTKNQTLTFRATFDEEVLNGIGSNTATPIEGTSLKYVLKIDGNQVLREAVGQDYTIEMSGIKLRSGSHEFIFGRTGIHRKFFRETVVIYDNCEGKVACAGPHDLGEYLFRLCNQIPNLEKRSKCIDCFNIDNAVWTAIGCIPTNINDMMSVLIKIGLMIGGGVALIIILAGGFQLTISQGDPKKTSEAKELITSALIGLVFIIFSVAILQLIGVQILQIPEFGE